MKAPRLLFAVCAALALSLTPAPADESHFKIFGATSYVSPLGENDVSIGGVRDSVKASNKLGWDFGLEDRFNRFAGLEIDYVNATNDVRFGGHTIGDVELKPLSVTLDFHVIPTHFIDLYVGPTASYFLKGDAHLKPSGDVTTDGKLAWGVSAGLEIGLGRTFAVIGGVRWVKVDLEVRDTSTKLPVDPLFSRLGVAFRF
ncbi:MAG TPA: outer membrane beta-barrel protein [Verrucomicrobiae bacterium]|nr:outer membrane beta-barrel protein [Verrucomicrobiae bacterium]